MLELRNVSFSYTKGRKVLKNISLDVKAGEFVLLLGDSGSGKTSLTRLINGLIPKVYQGVFSGQVCINGQAMEGLDMVDLSHIVGSVFQNPRNQFFTLDSTSELAFTLENQGIAPETIKKQIKTTLSTLKLEHLKDKELLKLSGGQMQAVAIASLVTLNPELLVFDEPSANLDEEGCRQLAQQLEELKRQGKTIIISEHRTHYLKKLVDQVILLEDGRISKKWQGEKFFDLEDKERVSLGFRSFQPPSLVLSNKVREGHGNYLEVRNLSLGYKEKLIKEVSFRVEAGEIVGFIGENACGKTSLFHVLAGIKKQDTGHVFYNGEILTRRKRRKITSLVMQDPSYQFFMESIEAELLMGCKDRTEEDYLPLLEKLNLLEKRQMDPLKISGGEKQRLAIAISLLDKKDIFLFDEPSSGLDYKNMKSLADLLVELQQLGKIILFISHDYELLSEVCTKIFMIENGKIQQALI